MRLFLALCLLFLFACGTDDPVSTPPGRLPYSTTSDSARYYYDLGWQQIMDEGRYGQAEVSYRKALEHDPDFLLAKATLGRLSLDAGERKRLYEEIVSARDNTFPVERKVLNVYAGLLDFTNQRAENPEAAKEMIKEVLALAEGNLRGIIHYFTEEPYLKSEYVEILNSNHGPQAALDSLAALTRQRHADNHFLLGFKAHLLAATGDYDGALLAAHRLDELVTDPLAPKVPAVYADAYFAMDSLELAHTFAQKAVRLDPRNLDASRLLTQIEKRLAN